MRFLRLKDLCLFRILCGSLCHTAFQMEQLLAGSMIRYLFSLEQLFKCIAIHGFVADQVFCNRCELLHMLLQNVLTGSICIQNHLADFSVNLGCQIFRNGITALHHFTSQEDFLLTAAVIDRTNHITHTILGNHALGNRGGTFNIIGSAGGNVIHCQLFRYTTAEQYNQIIQHFLLGGIEFFFLRQAHGKAAGTSAGYNGYRMHRILCRQTAGCNGMTCLMIRSQLLLTFTHDTALLFRTHDNLEEGILNILHADQTLVAACCQQSCFIQQVLQICTGKACGGFCNGIKPDIRVKLLTAGMYTQDCFTALHIRFAYIDLTVKASRTQQCRIQNILTVGCCNDNDAFICTKAIHLNQQLVQRLFPFIMSAAKACTSVASHCVNFVDEYNRRGIFLCLIEQVTDTGCTHAYIQLYKV